MSTIGYLLILIGILVARQVSKGRVANINEDLSDAFLAIIRGDTDALGEVLTRTGDANTPTVSDPGTSLGEGTFQRHIKGNDNGLAAAAMILGKAAKGYRWAATGPDYYDCSGLVWRAAQKVGFTGVRFTTATIGASSQFQRIAAPGVQGPGIINATINDVVCWPGHHMGVVTGPNKFYSARNPKVGIGETSISGFRDGTPVYYRLKVK